MVDPISTNNAAQNANRPAEQARFEPPARTDVQKADVVELSHSAQAKLLRQQGMNVFEIAIKLGLDVKTVSSYLPFNSPQSLE